jgi:hypothetical protein
MQSSHAASAVDIVFDDPNLIADGGLVSVVALAEQVGLPELVADLVTITGVANSAGANPASAFHARATTATIRAHLINIPARLARSTRRLTLHLPERWPWEPAWANLHAAIRRPRAA